MDSRFYALNSFIAPDFSVLVPNWTFGAAVNQYRSASHAYHGPVYLLLTPSDVCVLINDSPDNNPDAVDLLCRLPHEGRINHTPDASSVREASFSEGVSALGRLARHRGRPLAEVVPAHSVWMAGDVGFCIHDEPHRVTVFQFQDQRCVDLVAATDAQRIEPIAEQ
ncbi:hypothetical protein [Aquisalimonas asiatica]|uniref:Uncharacterized protein n=1 Tax=Aquisalimonas asiatica TaxID=406100 RepID=A0A1H8V0Z1_9GAMM|nr:hypothetical protein [Aquisalimonas asiatica]SEP09061.1 hypothetical protein SAMN04488052_10944 [Aquisalimonas asiatica]